MAGETKKRIIETALALFSQSGYLATSMNDIAQQVGLTKAALYKHFSGKQEILDCIIASTPRDKSGHHSPVKRSPVPSSDTPSHLPLSSPAVK